MQTVRGEKRCVADLEVGDAFFHNWDRRCQLANSVKQL